MLDEQNGVMIVAAYQETNAHYTELLFFGPDGEENAQQWSDYAEWSEEPDQMTETEEAIRDCFSLPTPPQTQAGETMKQRSERVRRKGA